LPKTNADFWHDKITKNQARDCDTDRRLEEAGWTIVRVWEHEPVANAVGRVLDVLGLGVTPVV
jgi:DNA mismatch endonuclease, patch repair protein